MRLFECAGALKYDDKEKCQCVQRGLTTAFWKQQLKHEERAEKHEVWREKPLRCSIRLLLPEKSRVRSEDERSKKTSAVWSCSLNDSETYTKTTSTCRAAFSSEMVASRRWTSTSASDNCVSRSEARCSNFCRARLCSDLHQRFTKNRDKRRDLLRAHYRSLASLWIESRADSIEARETLARSSSAFKT